MKKKSLKVLCSLILAFSLVCSFGSVGAQAAVIDTTTYLGLFNAYAGNKTADAEVYSYDEHIVVTNVEWKDAAGRPADTFVMGEYYDVTVTLKPTSGSCFDVDSPYFGVAFDGKIAYFNEADSSFREDRVIASYTMKYPWEYADVLEYNDPWYYGDVLYISQRGIMNGTGGGCFSPEGTTTRAMVVTILHRMAGEPKSLNDGTAFIDLEQGSWYEDAVLWAEDAGIAAGTSDTTFSPNANVTREQFLTFLQRYSRLWLSLSLYRDSMAITGFADEKMVSDYAYGAFQWGAGSGIVQGSRYADGGVYLLPQGEATRAQVSAFIHRFCEKYGQ